MVGCSLTTLILTFDEKGSNVDASSFITFYADMLRPNEIRFQKELFTSFKLIPFEVQLFIC